MRCAVFALGKAVLTYAACAPLLGAAVPGHVVGWGNNLFGQATPPADLGNGIIAVAAGTSHSLALRTDGTVAAWGDDSEGQSTVPPGLTNVIAIAARLHSVALKSDGTVAVWGSSRSAVTSVPANATNIVGIAAGGIIGRNQIFTVALRGDGTVVAWGEASAGETNVPPALADVVQVAGGAFDALALRRDGSVVTWGETHPGDIPPPGSSSGIIAVRGGQFVSLGLRGDGTLRAWGEPVGNAAVDETPPGISGLADVQMGLTHTVALRANGTVSGWGVIYDGQGPAPLLVPPGIQGITAIAAGDNHDLAISAAPLVLGVSPTVSTNLGAKVMFFVNASGAESFQWQHRGRDLPGQTNATLTILNAQPTDGGNYTVQVKNVYAIVTSPPMLLFFPSISPPVITAQPESIFRFRGQEATFRVAAQGEAPLTYQWFKDGSAVSGASDSSLTLRNVSSLDAGSYTVVVGDAADAAVTSTPAALAVLNSDATSSVRLSPVVDTSIFSSSVNPQVSTILVGTRGNGIMDRGLVRFDVSSLARPDLIQSVELQLAVVKAPRFAAGAPFTAHRMLTPWGEDATWVSAGAGVAWSAEGAAAALDFAAAPSGSGLATLAGAGLRADVLEWLANPASNHGWLLKSDREDLPRSALHFGSMERGPAPQLVIEYLIPPIPQLAEVRRTGDNITFALTGAINRAYRVEQRDRIAAGLWTTVTNLPANLSADPIVFSFPLDTPQRFYRVVVD